MLPSLWLFDLEGVIDAEDCSGKAYTAIERNWSKVRRLPAPGSSLGGDWYSGRSEGRDEMKKLSYDLICVKRSRVFGKLLTL